MIKYQILGLEYITLVIEYTVLILYYVIVCGTIVCDCFELLSDGAVALAAGAAEWTCIGWIGLDGLDAVAISIALFNWVALNRLESSRCDTNN